VLLKKRFFLLYRNFRKNASKSRVHSRRPFTRVDGSLHSFPAFRRKGFPLDCKQSLFPRNSSCPVRFPFAAQFPYLILISLSSTSEFVSVDTWLETAWEIVVACRFSRDPTFRLPGKAYLHESLGGPRRRADSDIIIPLASVIIHAMISDNVKGFCKGDF